MDVKKQKALSALVASPTIVEAAKVAGLSERTMRRYLKDDEFMRAYSDAIKELANEAVARLLHAIAPAVEALEAISRDEDAPPSTRIQAASAVLSCGVKVIDRASPAMALVCNVEVPRISEETRAEMDKLLGINPR